MDIARINSIFAIYVYFLSSLIAQEEGRITSEELDQLVEKGEIFIKEKNFLSSLEILNQALSFAEVNFSDSSLQYAKVLHTMGKSYHLDSKYEEAELSFKKALGIREKVLGRDAVEYQATLNNLGVLYRQIGNYPKAEAVIRETIELKLKNLGPKHPSYATSVNTLGTIYVFMGEPRKAEPHLLEAKQIREEVLEKTHPDYAQSLNSLGNLYYTLGDYKRAEVYFLEAIGICPTGEMVISECALTPSTNLATLYIAMGEYAKAELCYQQCTTYFLHYGLGDHPNYAVVLHNLARLHEKTGQYEKAKVTIRRVLEIRLSKLGNRHPEYVKALNNLGVILFNNREWKEAESVFLQASEIYKINQHFDQTYYENLSNLGLVYLEQNNFPLSRIYLDEALRQIRDHLGDAHDEFARVLFQKGNLLYSENKFDSSNLILNQVRDLQIKNIGTRHRDYAKTLEAMARNYWQMNDLREAGILLVEVVEINRALMTNTMGHLSPVELAGFTKFFEKVNDLFYSLLLRDIELPVGEFWNQFLFQRNFLLHSLSRSRELMHADSSLETPIRELQRLNYYLADLYNMPSVKMDEKRITEWRIDSIEKTILYALPDYSTKSDVIKWQDLKTMIRKGDLIIDFFHFRKFNPEWTDSIIYGAFILQPGWENPKYIYLFEEDGLSGSQIDYPDISPISGRISNKKYALLYEQIWKPFEQYLSDVQYVYFAADGILHRFPLAAIAQLSEGKTPYFDIHMHQRSSFRNLTNLIPRFGDQVSECLVVGGVMYDAVLKSVDKPSLLLVLTAVETIDFQAVRSMMLKSHAGPWEYLPWSEVEAKTVASLCEEAGISVRLCTGTEASEGIFRSLGDLTSAPGILHVATHGFFLPDTALHENLRKNDFFTQRFHWSDNPMLKSGLILAGANRDLTSEKPIPASEDGILTAFEVSQLDLAETELVVLSACESGLGDIRGNEGVYGLQRAFKIAGAKYLLMSLWQVPDFATQELMAAFYQNWLKMKMDIPTAFREAQKSIRIKKPDPFYWAGFVLVE